MSVWEDLLPAVIIVCSNLYGGSHESKRYAVITAIFGWLGAAGLTFGFIGLPIMHFLFPETKALIEPYAIRFTTFTLIAALSRDYERILKPCADKFLNHKKDK